MDQGKNVESDDINFRFIIWIKNASKQNKNDKDWTKKKVIYITLENSFHTRENN